MDALSFFYTKVQQDFAKKKKDLEARYEEQLVSTGLILLISKISSPYEASSV